MSQFACKPGTRWLLAWFLKLLFVCDVEVCVCVRVCVRVHSQGYK